MTSDISAMVILFLSNQKIQMNIILRHFIEDLLYCSFANLISNFSAVFHVLYISNWKSYRKPYSVYLGIVYPIDN